MHKYLSVDESNKIRHRATKEKRKECYLRVWETLKTEINTANHMEAINSLAIPVITYSFNIINWTIPEVRRLYMKI